MNDRDCYEADYQDALTQAERVVRFSWKVIATACAASLAVLALCFIAWVGLSFGIAAMD
ncbi:hypothetical protein [Streptomyces kurssanovii]|uniref:Uncharacterized protein n=1 Tax=Streptomyces kurssanovii TaxID=67312 RepID=A0ABV3I059_9ACTN